MEKVVKVTRKDGVDAGVIAHLVQAACKYDSQIYIKEGDKRVNAKSIMGMMNMVVASGQDVTIIAEGADERDAINEMETVLNQ